MCQEQGLNPAQRELESALARIRPIQSGLDRDLLMFNAGRATARPNRAWQVLSGVLGILLLCAVSPRPEQAGRPSSVQVADSGTAQIGPLAGPRGEHDPSGPLTYLSLRDRVLEGGVEALPPDPGTGSTGRLDRGQALVDILSS